MEAEGGAQQYCFGLSRVAQVGFTRFVAPKPYDVRPFTEVYSANIFLAQTITVIRKASEYQHPSSAHVYL
jgi:hypothetical protein